MTKDEALKLALEALELHLAHHEHGCVYLDPALAAIKEVLAQPAQEPDRQELQANGTHPAPCARHCEATAFNIVIRNLKAQLAQPAQEPVAWIEHHKGGDNLVWDDPNGKRTPLYTAPPAAQPAQEPLEYWNAVEGWVKIEEVREHFGTVGCGTIYKTAGEDRVPLYTNPPQCPPWVGLTDEEVKDSYNADYQAQTRAVQAKLKDKNT
jgi:hypothetical protein